MYWSFPAAEQKSETFQAVDVYLYNGCAQALHTDSGPAGSDTLQDRDHPFAAATSQDRALTPCADPYIFPESHWCARLGGLGNGLLTQEGNQQRGAAGSNQGRKVRPTVAATKGPKDELTAQPKSGLCPTDGNPCVGMLDSSESNAQAYHSLLQQLVQPVAVCVWRYTCTCVYMYICTHNVWCFSSLYLNYILK